MKLNPGAVQVLVLTIDNNVALWNMRKKRNKQPTTHRSSSRIRRKRKSILKIHRELGPTFFKRAFRMDLNLFWKLFTLIKPALIDTIKKQQEMIHVCQPNQNMYTHSMVLFHYPPAWLVQSDSGPVVTPMIFH